MSRSFRENESGVSPVIGVMLMLVVTIIVAAVVSAFAGGLTDSSTDVPVAAFEFKVYKQFITASYGPGASDQVVAIMKSGEAIDTQYLKIVSYYKDDDGNIVSHEFTESQPGALFFAKGSLGTDTYFGKPGTYWHTGDKFFGLPGVLFGVTPDRGDTIEINVVHKPTNTVIWSDEVTVI